MATRAQTAADAATGGRVPGRTDIPALVSRLVVGAVFALNVDCALGFALRPERYVTGFELAGAPGEAAVRGLGIAFLMWNATYPPVIWRPHRYRMLFAVVLAQQAIGLVGESWLLLTLPAGHAALEATLQRFAFFDGVGLIAMAAAFVLLGREPAAAAPG